MTVPAVVARNRVGVIPCAVLAKRVSKRKRSSLRLFSAKRSIVGCSNVAVKRVALNVARIRWHCLSLTGGTKRRQVYSISRGFVMIAKIVKGFVVVEAEYFINNQHVIETRCGWHEEYESLPQIIEYEGKQHVKTGWNSDIKRAYYKTGVPVARIVA